MISDEHLLAPKPDVDYKALPAQPSPQDFLVLTRVKGVVSVAQLCTSSGLGREKTLAAIDVLLDVGLLHVVDGAGNPDPSFVRETPAPPQAEPEPEPVEPEPLIERSVAQIAAEEALGSDDQTYVVGGDIGGFAMVPSEAGEEPLVVEPHAAPLAQESEVIALPPEQPDEPFEIDHQPIAFGMEDLIDLSGASSISSSAVAPSPPRVPDEPVAPSPASQSSFDTLAPDDEDDDLFMAESPAHIDRVVGRAPIKRDHGKNRAAGATAAVAHAVAQKAAPKESPAPPKISSANAASYRFFPTDFADYTSQHAAIPDLDPSLQHEIDFVFDNLEFVDFYQLFGVDPAADRKVIRASYFELSKRFHPDKFFRDEVGDVRERVDAIFRFVTKGYQTLSKKKNREEYDRALEQARSAASHGAADDDRKRAMAADMLERRAVQLEQQGQLAHAAAEYKKVASLRRDAHAFVKAASLLLRANQQLDEAASLARAAVRQLPLEVEPRLVLGQIYEKNQMFAEAEQAFGDAEAIAPGDPAVRVHLERIRSQN